MKKKIVNIVLNDFVNDSRVWKTSRSLVSMGYNVTVVALHNSKLKENEKTNGFVINRIKLVTKLWPKIRAVQIVKYIEFFFKASWRYRKADIVHCNDLNALPVGVFIKLIGRNVKIVYDCHEYETEVQGLRKSEKFIFKLIERLLIKKADRVVTVSDSIALAYATNYGIEKPGLVLNCPMTSPILDSNILRDKLNIKQDQKIFLYQGVLSKGRGIELLIDAFASLDSKNIALVFMGYGILESTVTEAAIKNSNIYFQPAVEPKEILEYTSSADYGLCFIEDTCLNYRYCLPNKAFEYLMAGLPIITSNLPELRKLVVEYDVGLVAVENTVDSLCDVILESLKLDCSEVQKNIILAREKYSWTNQEKVLKSIYSF